MCYSIEVINLPFHCRTTRKCWSFAVRSTQSKSSGIRGDESFGSNNLVPPGRTPTPSGHPSDNTLPHFQPK